MCACEFGVEEGVEDECSGGVVFAEASGCGWEVICEVADIIGQIGPCMTEVVEVPVCETCGESMGEEPRGVVGERGRGGGSGVIWG